MTEVIYEYVDIEDKYGNPKRQYIDKNTDNVRIFKSSQLELFLYNLKYKTERAPIKTKIHTPNTVFEITYAGKFYYWYKSREWFKQFNKILLGVVQ